MTFHSAPTLLLVGAWLLATPSQGQGRTLTLEQAVELALTRNERAQAAQARADAARARVLRARSFFFPDLNAQGVYTRRLYQTIREVGGQSVVVQRFNALSANATLGLTL